MFLAYFFLPISCKVLVQLPNFLILISQAYLREALLEQHMRSHRGVKPFVCNECGLQFTVKSNWQRHVAEHSGTRLLSF